MSAPIQRSRSLCTCTCIKRAALEQPSPTFHKPTININFTLWVLRRRTKLVFARLCCFWIYSSHSRRKVNFFFSVFFGSYEFWLLAFFFVLQLIAMHVDRCIVLCAGISSVFVSWFFLVISFNLIYILVFFLSWNRTYEVLQQNPGFQCSSVITVIDSVCLCMPFFSFCFFNFILCKEEIQGLVRNLES